MLHVFFWVVPQCQRFGTPCLFHLHRRVGMKAFKLPTPGNNQEEHIPKEFYRRSSPSRSVLHTVFRPCSSYQACLYKNVQSKVKYYRKNSLCYKYRYATIYVTAVKHDLNFHFYEEEKYSYLVVVHTKHKLKLCLNS
jgi:hypothetical protein